MPAMPRPKKALKISNKILKNENITPEQKQSNKSYYVGNNGQQALDIKNQIVR